jgi:hypothetical protein
MEKFLPNPLLKTSLAALPRSAYDGGIHIAGKKKHSSVNVPVLPPSVHYTIRHH